MAELKNDEMKAILASSKLSEATRTKLGALIDSSGTSISSGMLAGVWALLHSVESKEDFKDLLESLE